MKVHGKRILSAFLALVMVVGLLPATAMAAEVAVNETVTVFRDPQADYVKSGAIGPALDAIKDYVDLTEYVGYIGEKNVTEATLTAWKTAIAGALGYESVPDDMKVEYYVGRFQQWYSLDEGDSNGKVIVDGTDFLTVENTLINGILEKIQINEAANRFFGMNSVLDGNLGREKETVRVTIGDKTYTDLTVYVQSYVEVEWLMDDGKTALDDPAVTKIAVGTTPTHDAPAKVADAQYESYAFAAWEPVPEKVTTSNAKDELYKFKATFTPGKVRTYNVTWMNGEELLHTEQVEYGVEPKYTGTLPSKEGFNFIGWEPEIVAVDKDATYTAKYNAIDKFTVNFINAGMDPVAVESGKTVKKPADPTKEGYRFDGWYTDAEYKAEFDFNAKITADTDIYAKWLAKYIVTFNANGGEGEMGFQTFVQTQPQKLAENEFVKQHHTFLGWATTSDGLVKYTDGDSVTAEGNMTLYAVWQKIDATPTVIKANNAVVTYGDFNAADLMEQIAPIVTVEGNPIKDAVVTIKDIDEVVGYDAGTHNVTLIYGGSEADNYDGDTETVTVTINKAAAVVVVSSQTVKYGQTPADPFKANCNTIDVLAGLDVHDETYLVGAIQIGIPDSMNDLFTLAKKLGVDLSDLTIEEFKAMLGAIENISDFTGDYAKIKDVVAELRKYQDTLEKLIATLEKIQDELPRGSELKISVVSEIKLPTNIGVYLAASLASDKNYEAVNANDGLDAGYLIITPNGIKAELSWNENDDNHIITLDKYADFDLGATAKVIDSTVEGANKADKVEDHLEYIFIGVDANGELLLNRTTNVTEMADAAIGVYAQVAYVANWDNVMYYAEPIARPVVIAPNVADVAILDGNGNENYAQVFTYDGTAKAVTVTVDGEENAEGLTVKYIGSDTTVDGWYRTEAPTDAGVYTVVATYTEKNDAGELVKAGGAVGVLIIEPADADITMPDAEYKYDGAEHFPKLTEGFDFVTVAIDREDNVAYVNLPEDTADHIDRIVTMMPAEVENELRAFLKKYENFDGEAQTATLKTELSAIIDKAVAVDMTAKAEAMAEKLVDKLAEALKNNQDIDTLVEKIKTEIAALEDAIRNEIPEPLEDYIRDIVTITENGVDIDLEKAKADIKAMIDQVKDELPDPVVAELYEMVDELTRAIEGKVDVEALKDKATQIVEELKSLEVADAETLVKAVIGAIYNNLDMTQIQSLLEQVVAKVEARGYVDYLKNMVKAISGMYEGKIDTTEVETAIDALITKIEKKIEFGNFDADDLEALETSVDAILNSLKSVVNQIPEGTIIFGKNPTEVGEYDCYAMNISANYKWEFVESKMKIYYEITFDANGGSGEMDAERIIVDTYTLPENGFTAPTGKHFVGWSLAANGTVISSESIDVRDNTTLYAIWAQNSTGGNTGGGGGSSRPDIEDPNITGVVNYLNTDDHFPFMVGDDKGAFRPNANITRAEVAQVFYALLKDKNVTITAGFDDVEEGIWYETAVNTLASMGIVAGVGDGKFEPERPITRAEFAAIAAKFAKKSYTGMKFDDVSEDHWAYPGICTAASYGWVTGIGDNKFGPMQKITRAEVATIVNHMLGRLGDWDAIDNGEGRWFPDVTKSHWAWYEIAEATTDHDYKFNQKRTEETWSKSKPNPPMQ